MATDYLEAILIWSERGPSPAANQYLERHGLSVTPMATGLLVSGTAEQFAAAFHVDLSDLRRPFKLPVPDALKDSVASVEIPTERRPYGSSGP